MQEGLIVGHLIRAAQGRGMVGERHSVMVKSRTRCVSDEQKPEPRGHTVPFTIQATSTVIALQMRMTAMGATVSPAGRRSEVRIDPAPPRGIARGSCVRRVQESRLVE